MMGLIVIFNSFRLHVAVFITQSTRFACVTYGWIGWSIMVKLKGDRNAVMDAYNNTGAYTAIMVDRHTREVVAEKISPAGDSSALNQLKVYASQHL